MHRRLPFYLPLLFCLGFFSLKLPAASGPAILPLREQARVTDQWLEARLQRILPEVMRREKIDLWLVICQEYNEDPVFLTLVPAASFSARRLSILAFHDRGAEGIERLNLGRYGIDRFYQTVWNTQQTDQWQCLAQTVARLNPRRIGIDQATEFAFGDGLSAGLKEKLLQALGPALAARLVSAERLAVGWLERRLPEELEVYPQIVAIAHGIIAEAFSNAVITPGVSRCEEVTWWMREKIRALGLDTWFQPAIEIQRPQADKLPADAPIRRGDLLHCDMGIRYLGLCSDTQELAYVLRENESDAPPGLKKALQDGNRLQDILLAEFRQGRTGNEILRSALAAAKKEGLLASIYTHPLGFHGHAAGPTIGLWDHQEGVPGVGDYPLFNDTCFSIELNVGCAVPEWGGQHVRLGLEEDAALTQQGIYFLDGRQTALHLIK